MKLKQHINMKNFKEYIKEVKDGTVYNAPFKKVIENSKKIMGYKIVGWDGNKAFSIYNINYEIPLNKGDIISDPKGVYLGNSKKYVISYFSGGTNYQDLLLTYEYDSEDVMQGDPEFLNGEVKVKSARLVNIEKLDENI